MLLSIAHAVVHAAKVIKAVAQGRSPKWPGVEKQCFIRDGYRCRWCGKTLAELKALGAWLEGHHVVSFHERPDLELVLANILTMCRDKTGRDHLHEGHRDPKTGKCAWTLINPNVVREAAEHRAKLTHT